MAANHTPLDEIAAVLEALGEAVSPPVRAYLAWCESPVGKRTAYLVNNAPLVLGALAVAMLTAEPSGEPFCAASMCASPACGARCAWSVSGNPL